MKKTLFTLFLSLVASVGTIYAWDNYYSIKIGDLYYNLYEENMTAEVTYQDLLSEENYAGLTNVTIPKSVEYDSKTYTVTKIGGWAFNMCSTLKSVTIPNSVTYIEGYAFAQTGLTSVTIPQNVTYIGNDAFSMCEITSVIWNAKNCNACTFGTSVESFVFGEEVESIPAYCCARMTKLTSITIPDNVTSVGPYAFEGCSGLTEPIYNAHVFAYLPHPHSSVIESYVIPSGIESIAGGAFSHHGDLKHISIPNSVTIIGDGAFEWCQSLTSVTLPSNLTKIGGWAFNYCNGLTSMIVPPNVTSIGNFAFSECFALTTVTLPNTVTEMEEGAFESCSQLQYINIPDHITYIASSLFEDCYSLKSVTIPSTVTFIGCDAFWGCRDLKSITIPKHVTYIRWRAFSDCTSLASITCKATVPPVCELDDVFEGVNEDIYIYVPKGTIEKYKNAEGWNKLKNFIPINQAEEASVSVSQATPTDNSVVISWPVVTGAVEYSIQLWKGEELDCELSFNDQGQLMTVSDNKKAGKGAAQTATQTATGWQYTIGGLEPGTEYSYTVIAKNGEEELLKETKTFVTEDAPMDVENIMESTKSEIMKFVKDGQLYILRGDEIYTTQGARVE